MYIVIYKFSIRPEFREKFITAWKSLTEEIFENNGSLGSRLHRENQETYIAYAQWPSEEKFNAAVDLTSNKAIISRAKMKEACFSITTLHKLEVIEDLLK